MAKAKINLQAVSSLEKAPRTGTKRRLSSFSFSKRKPATLDDSERESRGIQFATRSVESKLTLCFYALFILMFVVLVLTFGRLSTITHLANEKAVNKTALVTDVKHDLNQNQWLTYQGNTFIKALINQKKGTDSQATQKAVAPYLAEGLTVDKLGFSQASEDRTVQNVTFIQSKVVNAKKKESLFAYDVMYTEGKETITLNLALPVSVAHNQLRLVSAPVITNLQQLEQQKNKTKADDQIWKVSGDTISTDDQKKIADFMGNFFDLYVKNDEKLSMISDLKGLNGAKLENQNLTAVVKTKNDHFVATGSYQIHFGSGSTLSSPYQATLRKNGDTYYLETLN